jgi:DNA-binding cell septation regulator SpoVG
MQVTNVKVYPMVQGTLRAYADITIDNSLFLRKLRLLRNTGGYMLCMPNVRQTDGSFREMAYPAGDEETLKLIKDAVIAEYKKVTGPRSRSRRRVWLPT